MKELTYKDYTYFTKRKRDVLHLPPYKLNCLVENIQNILHGSGDRYSYNI